MQHLYFDEGASNTISIPQSIAVELSTILTNEWTLDKSVVWLFIICNVFTVSSNNIDVLKLFNVCNTFKPETLNCQFLLVVLFNVVKSPTFNDDKVLIAYPYIFQVFRFFLYICQDHFEYQ